MGLIDDPISGVLGVFFKRAMDSKLWQRVQLVLEMGLAGAITFLVSCGGALVSGSPVAFSVGLGMLLAGVAMLATFMASPNSKGLTLSLPEQVTKAAQDNTTITEKK